jgi:hypothetical protein
VRGAGEGITGLLGNPVVGDGAGKVPHTLFTTFTNTNTPGVLLGARCNGAWGSGRKAIVRFHKDLIKKRGWVGPSCPPTGRATSGLRFLMRSLWAE